MDITRAYWGLVTARENARVLKQALDRADAWVGDVKSRVDAGVLPPNDLLSAQAQRAREYVQLIQATNDAAVARNRAGLADRRRTRRQPIEPTSRVDQSLSGAADLADQTAVALAATGREQRGRADRLVGAAGRSRGKCQRRAGWHQAHDRCASRASSPRGRTSASCRARTSGTSPGISGVNAHWPLFDGGKSRADAATASAQAESIAHRIEQFDARLALEVRQRLLDISASRAALAASGEAVAAATEAHRVVSERFNAGVATSTDVLDAQVALLEAELERTRLTAGFA